MNRLLCVVVWMMTAVAVAADVDWDVDPYSWTRDGGVFVSRGGFKATAGGVAVARVPCCRTVRMRAEISVADPGRLLAGGAGIAIRDNFETCWTLTLNQSAKGAGCKRYASLDESLHREGGAQKDLVTVRAGKGFKWKTGTTYAMELEMSAKGVRGRIALPGADKALYESEYEFNGRPAADRGRPALYVFGDYKAKVTNVTFETADEAEPTRVPIVPYASDQYIRGVTSKATGFFRCEKVDGRWTLIDPLGRGYMGLGIGLCSKGAGYCEALGYSEYARVNAKKFPEPGQWEEDTIAKLKDWGFTTFGNGVQRSLLRRGLSTCFNLYLGRRMSMADDEWAIDVYEGHATSGFPNVFHPKFAEACDFLARDYCARYKDDPWLLGYYLDNEIDWRGGKFPAYKRALGLFDAAMSRPKGHTARQAAEAFLAGREVTDEIRHGFLKILGEKYFSSFAAAIRRHDPNHMILGCRFPGIDSACDEVWSAAAKYCDVLTFNFYPWIDLDTGVVTHNRVRRPFREVFEARFAKCDRPFYVTEWSFNALDSGLPCLVGAGQVFQRQAQRARAAEIFARTIISSPCFVGYDFFSWLDQPALGWSAADPENSNFGLVRMNGEPYEEMTSMFRRIHGDLARYRNEPMPEPKVTFARNGNAWKVANAAGLELRGAVGDKLMVRDVFMDGFRLGAHNAKIVFDETENPEIRAWWEVTAVKNVEYREQDGFGLLTVAADGDDRAGRRFRIVHRFTVPPFGRDVRVEIVGVSNIGEKPFTVDSLTLQQYPSDPKATSVPVPRRNMNRWEDRDCAVWQFSNGHRFGMESMFSPNAVFRMFPQKDGTFSQQMSFRIPGMKRVAPGEKWKPVQQMRAKTIFE